MEKQSVKKPFTILVAVILVLVFGVVSVSRMTSDLLPNISMPYLMVITTYPGASPEKVEQDVARPIEAALGTVTGVENIYSTSSENFGTVQLEFADGTDMDSALVKVTSALQQVQGSLPELCSTPSVIEISMDMMATMYVSVSRDGYDIFQLSAFVENTVIPALERQNGVASISGLGLVEQSIQVQLNQEKIDALNDRILATVDDKMAQALTKLEEAEKEVATGKEELEKAQSSFGQTVAGTIFDTLQAKVLSTADAIKLKVDTLLNGLHSLRKELGDGETGVALDEIIEALQEISQLLSKEDISIEKLLEIGGSLKVITQNLSNLLNKIDIESLPSKNPGASLTQVRKTLEEISVTLSAISQLLQEVPEILAGLEGAIAGLSQAQIDAAVGFANASSQLSSAEVQLSDAKAELETARENAMKSANVNALLSLSTLSQLIYAQNFSMPAGYIDDASDSSWLLKVGEEFESLDALSKTLLVSMDGVGQVRLEDVADINLIDNAGQSYSRLNGEQAVILSIYKNSTTGTNETANNCLTAFQELEQRYEGCHMVTLMNQGSYIDVIIETVVSSMIFGALLAIIILALFLKDAKPTIVVAISIPLSVMVALVLMYFTGISLNMMTLSGLALGIGMLVDNSVVVIENIYRLRGRGISAPRAAVQGTKQVAGAIISSTLTTICVFLPLVFTEGMVKELLLPLGLCIGYCLTASLLVALTVVPAAASTLLKKSTPKPHPWFDKFLNLYGKLLNWCLNHRWIPITAATALLAICIWAVLNTGIVLLPDMTADQITVTVSTPENTSREESYAMADEVIDLLLEVDGVEAVGVMDSSAATGLLGGMSTGGEDYGRYSFYIVTPKGTPASEIKRITQDINQITKGLSFSAEAAAGGIDDMTAMLGNGLSVNIYGENLQVLEEISQEVSKIVETVPGYSGISTSFSSGEAALHLKIDKDKAMEKGLTVAQIYMVISEKLTTSAHSTTITVDGIALDVTVTDNTNPLTTENLLQLEITATTMDATGTSVTATYPLSTFATVEKTSSIDSIDRENLSRYVTVSANIAEGYNATLLSRQLETRLAEYTSQGLPYGYRVEIAGESTVVNEMVSQMLLLILLGALLIYLVMTAQFQSLLSPFIVLFTVPLAFTGGMLGLLVYGQQLSLLSIMGFAVLMGTVVNNGIVFVDYVNQLRLGGLQRREALIATGKTRMRPILMTSLTTILAMLQLVFSDDMAGQLGGGMSVVIIGGLLYATLMTLIIIPVLYDIFFKRKPLQVDIGSENLDDIPDDAAEFLAQKSQNEVTQSE